MSDYDLCVAWNWEYDVDFITLLEAGCQSKGLSMLQITPGNLAELLHSLVEGQSHCRVFFDRASDVDLQFMPLVQWAHENRIMGINSYERASLTWDKAALHTQLVNQGLDVPHTIVLPSFFDQPDLPCIDIFTSGEQFTIKPAHGSGGVGVVTNVTSWEQVIEIRQQHASDEYLLQAHVATKEFDLRPAWFRVIFCTGQVFPCWWDPSSHIYSPVTPEEITTYHLERLNECVIDISQLCRLDLFSTEIAINQEGRFMIVDYVNDQIDLRLQSHYADGVPDIIVHAIIERLVHQLELRVLSSAVGPGIT